MNKKLLISASIFLSFTISVKAQKRAETIKGTVSFVSARNVYVKFASTKNIKTGDTLFINRNSNVFPALFVTNKSSSSTVCRSLLEEKMEVGSELIARIQLIIKSEKEDRPLPAEVPVIPPNAPVLIPEEESEGPELKQKIRGRISAASYSNISSFRTSHRMRYALSFRGKNLGGSKLSTDLYLTFRHTLGEWEKVKQDLGRALKVYALSATYDFTPNTRLTLGRKINPRLTSVGAIDGIQFEKGFGNFLIGAVAGTRPDFSNYGFNPRLLQYGAYGSYSMGKDSQRSTSTFGFMEQTNAGKTDRRFAYFQHSGQLGKKIHLFSSFEIDLYQLRNRQVSNQPRLTNLYVSLSYRLSKKLRFSAAYDSRRNIIYYESYQRFIDQLIEDETRQGLRLGFTFRPTKNITWGVNGGLRFQQSGINRSVNLNTYLSLNKMNWLPFRTTLRASILETGFLNSRIYGIYFSKPLLNRKINLEWYYRNVNYLYSKSEVGTAVQQHIAGLNLSWRLTKKLSAHLFFESTLDKNNPTLSRVNLRLIKRF